MRSGPTERERPCTLIFDGTCGFCTACVAALQLIDLRHRLQRMVPFQKLGVPESVGLTYAACEQAVWLVMPDGTRHRGAGAVCAALDRVFGIPLFLNIYAVRGIGRRADDAYTWVSAHRSNIPGLPPYCRSHPGECVPHV